MLTYPCQFLLDLVGPIINPSSCVDCSLEHRTDSLFCNNFCLHRLHRDRKASATVTDGRFFPRRICRFLRVHPHKIPPHQSKCFWALVPRPISSKFENMAARRRGQEKGENTDMYVTCTRISAVINYQQGNMAKSFRN